MKVTLLCNAGLALCYEGQTLLVDVPNCVLPPYATLAAGEWEAIINRKPPHENICGMYFTHNHPDHCDIEKVRSFQKRWPEIPCFFPEKNVGNGTVVMGPFVISYAEMDHAPMDVPTPPHVVTWIRAGATSIYIAADAKLDCEQHRKFLKGRVANGAFWNAMYLSRPETRELLLSSAERNFIYHMPEEEPDPYGIWKKCRNNLKRYGEELKNIEVLCKYPSQIVL